MSVWTFFTLASMLASGASLQATGGGKMMRLLFSSLSNLTVSSLTPLALSIIYTRLTRDDNRVSSREIIGRDMTLF